MHGVMINVILVVMTKKKKMSERNCKQVQNSQKKKNSKKLKNKKKEKALKNF